MPETVKPLVSAIMPTYNVEDFVSEAIDSFLRQTYSDVELIIVDDQSSDRTVKIIQEKIIGNEAKIRLVQQKHNGVSAARNAAFPYVNGQFVAFLDGDDIWPEDAIQFHLNLLLSNPSFDLTKGLIASFRHEQNTDFDSTKISGPLMYNTQLGSLLVHKKVFDQVGLFDISLSHGEDTDWFLRAHEAGIKFLNSEHLSLYYRRRTGSLTDRDDNSTITLLAVLRKSINRKRAVKTTSGAPECSTSA